jgi:dienelactone hydrolase
VLPGLLVVAAAAAGLLAAAGTMPWQLLREAIVALAAALAVLIVRRGSDIVGVVVALVVGVVCLGPGIGLGLGRVVHGSWDLTATAGCLLLTAGLALFIVGLAGLRVILRRARRATAQIAALAVTVLVVFPTWPAFYAVDPPAAGPDGRTPATLGLPAVDLRLLTPAGARLAAWYLPTRSGAAVVLLHGAGSTRSAVLDHAAVLWRNGYGVLALDARGHGRSTGRAMDFGWYGDDDVRGAVDRLSRLRGVDPHRIGVVGLSMGGEEALGAAATDRRITAVVAEGATGRSASDLGWLPDHYGWRGRLTQLWRGALTYGLTDILTAAAPPVSLRDAVRAAAPRPVLLVTAGELPDESAAAAFISAGSPRTVSTWTVPGAGHTRGLATQPKAWERRVVGFLDRAMLNR